MDEERIDEHQNSEKQLRESAWTIINAALQAVNPAQAVRNYFSTRPDIVARINTVAGRVLVIGAGKASAPMAQAVYELFGDRIEQGVVVVKYGHTLEKEIPNIEIVEAGHPVPDAAGAQATRRIVALAASATPNDFVLCLISGGGSALLTLPVEGVSLGDLQVTTQTLLAAGCSIDAVNTMRRHLSAVKGGQLARQTAPAPMLNLILSDVVGDPLEAIASGPTVPDPTTFADAWYLVKRYQLVGRLPEVVAQRLQAGAHGQIPDTPGRDDPVFDQVTNVVVGSNRIAAQAAVIAAQANGFDARLLTTFVEGEAREVGRVVAGLAKGIVREETGMHHPACLVMGGETTVTLTGTGTGGRNQEMALSVAMALDGWPGVLVVCLGTDGNDGPTDAAGAFADGSTVSRATAKGLDPADHLRRNDAYPFFAALDDLIFTGPTNTNVNDLTLVLVE
jgi:glycerate 2-kinase